MDNNSNNNEKKLIKLVQRKMNMWIKRARERESKTDRLTITVKMHQYLYHTLSFSVPATPLTALFQLNSQTFFDKFVA